jgi:hypothetical protein
MSKESLSAMLESDAAGLPSATASNARLGLELFEAGAVAILRQDGTGVSAQVGGGAPRSVEFSIDGESWAWRCICRKDQPRFCKHAVAVALAIRGGVRRVGSTSDGGFQAGSRRTYEVDPEEAWSFLVSPRGNELITGRETALGPDGPEASWAGQPIAYEVTTFSPGSHFRMKWRPAAWESPSTLQLRVIRAARGGTTIAFHQEGLADSAAREEMLSRWEAVHAELARAFSAGTRRRRR